MDIIMAIVGMCILCYIIFLGINNVPALKNFIKSDESFTDLFSEKFWAAIIHSPSMRKRIYFTLFIVVVYKLLYLIPVAGINADILSESSRQIGMSSGTNPGIIIKGVLINYFGGAYEKFYIMSLGFQPYLAVCIILLLSSAVVPWLHKKVFSENQKDKQDIANYALWGGLILCVIQSFFLSLWMERVVIYMGMTAVPHPGWGFRLGAVLSLSATYCLILWLASLITKRGIGNGVAVLILSNVVMQFVDYVSKGYLWIIETEKHNIGGILYIAALVPLFLLAVYLTTWKRNIPIEVKGQQTYLPFRISWAGQEPFYLTQSIILFPATVASFIPSQGIKSMAALFQNQGIFYYTVYSALIIFLSFVYVQVVFDRKFFIPILEKYSGKLLKAETGKDAIFYLEAILQKIALSIGIVLTLIAIFPDCVMEVLKTAYFVTSIYNVGLILITIGVLYDISIRMKALSDMENAKCQSLCYVASNELEAVIKKAYLEQNGVRCILDPIRFTWGMPIRTPIDEYRLNVSEQNVQKAQELLK